MCNASVIIIVGIALCFLVVCVLIILLLIGINVTHVGMDIIHPDLVVHHVRSDALNVSQLVHAKNALRIII